MKKIMTLTICVLLVIATVLSLTGCGGIVTSKFGEELIQNGGFESDLANWKAVKNGEEFIPSIKNHSSGNTSAGEKNLGKKCVSFTVDSGYAYLEQSIKIEPNQVYCVSAEMLIPSAITAGTKDKAFDGAFIGFAENVDFAGRESVTKVQTGWTYTYTYYFRTEFSEVTLRAGIGSLGKTATGTIWFDNISVKKVDPTASGIAESSIKTLGRANNGTSGIVYIALGAVLVLAFGYVAYRLIRRHGYVSEKKDNVRGSLIAKILSKKWMILVVLGVALIVRVLLAYFYTGYKSGMASTGSLANNLATVGFGALTSSNTEVLPLYGYVLWLIGSLINLLGIQAGSSIYYVFLRLPAIIADLVAIYFIYKLAKKFIGRAGGVIAGALYAVLPTVLTATSVWGATDSLFALLAILTLYFILNPNGLTNGKRYTGIFVSFVAGVLIRLEMLWLVPIVASFLIYNFMKKPDSRKSIIIGTIASIVAFYVVSLPIFMAQIGAGRVFYVWEYYFMIIKNGAKYALNNFGLYALVGLNGKNVTAMSNWMNLAFAALLFAFTLIIYFKNKSRLEIILIAAFTMIAASAFAIDMSATFAIVGTILLLVYAVISNEKRIYLLTIIFALFAFLNSAYVLNALGSLTPLLLGNTVIYLTGDVFMIVMSALHIIAICYFVYVLYDICINDKIKQIDYLG